MPLFEIRVIQKLGDRGSAGIVDENIDLRKDLENLRCGRFDALQIADVASNTKARRSKFLQFFDSFISALLVPAEHGHVGARLSIGGADAKPYSAVPSGDDNIHAFYRKCAAHALDWI